MSPIRKNNNWWWWCCFFLYYWLVNNVVVVAEDDEPYYYTAYQDKTWAITSKTLSSPDKQELYDNFMEKCSVAAKSDTYCVNQENMRLFMNKYQLPSVFNYTSKGFAKIRAPPEMFQLLETFWNKNKHLAEIEWTKRINPYHNTWDVETTIIKTDEDKFEGGGTVLHKKVWQSARDVLEEWTNQRLSPCSAYGIRLYHNQSILAPHVDRMPLVASAIINVDQDVDEPWPLEVYDHQGVAHNVTMQPGDMVMYESHSIIHGRPFPLNGNFYANIFVHFEPIGPLHAPMEEIQADSELPPYLIPGSPWEEHWRKDHQDGWQLFHDPHEAVAKGDIRTLQYMAEKKLDILSTQDENGWQPIHIAIQYGHLDILQFLIESAGIDRNKRVGDIHETPLEIARSHLSQDDPVIPYLLGLEQNYQSIYRTIVAGDLFALESLLADHPSNVKLYIQKPDQNGWYPIHIAVQYGQLQIVQYLIQLVGKNYRNTKVVKYGQTPLDIAKSRSLKNDALLQYLQGLEDEQKGYLLAHSAVAHGVFDGVRSIAETKPFRLLQPDEHGWSAIHLAVQYGQLEILKFLVSIGADPQVRIAGTGPTPLEMAGNILPQGDPVILFLEEHPEQMTQSQQEDYRQYLNELNYNNRRRDVERDEELEEL